MAFIKEESEDVKIEETFRDKHEDTEEQTKMEFIKEESEDMKIEETFKQEDTEEQTKMEFIKEESEDMKIEETFRVKHEDTEKQTGAKPRTGQRCTARGQKTKMPTLKDCYACREKIGVASKTCQHCRAKQPYKELLEKKKKQLSQEWKERQKKNSSVNKVYDATNLLLHKWELLERFPVLLLARRTSNGFSAECFCPWKMGTEDSQDAFLTIKRVYESLLNVAIADKEASSTGESSATNSTETPPADSTHQLTCNVSNKDKEASSMGESSATNSTETETSPEDSTADPASELTPESDTVLLPPASSSLASPVSFTTRSLMSLSIAPPVSPLTHPAFVSSQSSPISSSSASPLPPASNLSIRSKLSTEQGSSGPVASSRKKRQIKRKADPKECPMHEESTSFPYKKILRKRMREGHAEVLVQWHPCSGCGKKWKNSWEPKRNIQSSS